MRMSISNSSYKKSSTWLQLLPLLSIVCCNFGVVVKSSHTPHSFEYDVGGLAKHYLPLLHDDDDDNYQQQHEQQQQQQQQQQVFLNDAIQLVTKQQQQQRMLQQGCNVTEGSDNQCVLQTPEEVCESYNNQTVGILSCNCSRFGTSDTQVDCMYDAPQCSSDNSTCYIGSISQIVNIAGQSRAVTACTTYTQTVAAVTTDGSTTQPSLLDMEVCIRVFPMEDGNFDTLSSCSVSIVKPGQSQSDGSQRLQICNSCTICDASSESSNNNNNTIVVANAPKISFNCCNRMTDVKQTCASVVQGIAIPQTDLIPIDELGMCTSHAASSIFTTTTTMMMIQRRNMIVRMVGGWCALWIITFT